MHNIVKKKKSELPTIFVDGNCFLTYSFDCVFSALPGSLGHRRMREDGEAARKKPSTHNQTVQGGSDFFLGQF